MDYRTTVKSNTAHVDRQTLVNTLPGHKLRLQAVITRRHFSCISTARFAIVRVA